MQRIKNFFKEIFYFFTSGIVLRNLGGMLGLVVFVFCLLFFWMKCYTNHGESVSVPDLHGKSMDDIDDLLKVGNLRYEILDTNFFPDKDPNSVLKQDPVPNSKVKENRIIYLTINGNEAPLAYFPRIWGQSLPHAKRQLKNAGFEVGKIEERPDPATNTVLEVSYKGKVIENPLKEDTKEKNPKFPKYSKVDLIVATNNGMRINVPNFIGKTYSEALFIIDNFDINVGRPIVDGTVTDTANAYVWKQSLDPSETMRTGEMIDLWLTQTPIETNDGSPENINVPPSNPDGINQPVEGENNNGGTIEDPDDLGFE